MKYLAPPIALLCLALGGCEPPAAAADPPAAVAASTPPTPTPPPPAAPAGLEPVFQANIDFCRANAVDLADFRCELVAGADGKRSPANCQVVKTHTAASTVGWCVTRRLASEAERTAWAASPLNTWKEPL